MAKYRITAPDGGTYEVTAPDGASEADVLAYAQQNYRGASKPDFSNVQTSVSTRQGMGDGWTPGVGRDVMLGARHVVEGAGGLLGMIGGDAFNAVINKLGERAPTLSELASGQEGRRWERIAPYAQEAAILADRMGLPRPQNPTERVVGDIGRGLTGTALTMGAGSLLSGGGQLAQRAGNLLTAQPMLQSVSAATGSGAAGITRESGGGQGAQLLAGLAGGLAPGAAATGTAATLRGLVRGRSGEQMQRTIEDFNRLGANPSVGQASGRWGSQGAESLLAGGPTSAGVMTRFAERQAEDIGSGLQRMADDLSRNASAERAGRAISRGIHGPDGFTAQFKATQDQLFNRLDEFVPSQQPIALTNTKRVLGQLNAPIPGAPNVSRLFQNGRIAGIGRALDQDLAIPTSAQVRLDDALAQIDGLYASRDAAVQEMGRFRAFANEQANRTHRWYPVEGQPRIAGRYSPFPERAAEGMSAAGDAGQAAMGNLSRARQLEAALENLQGAVAATNGRLPYEAIKKLRTLVGQELQDAGLMSDFPRSKFKALYAALSQDLGQAAAEAGPEAQQAFSRANNYTRAGMERVESIERVIDKNGGPERVFQAAMSGTKDGGTTLRAVMQSLPADGQRAVTAAVIKRMGMASPGMQGSAGDTFSAATFLTNWNRVSPEARRALFDRHGPQFSRQMDQIARVAQNIKEGSKIYANPSGTANRAAAMTYGASLVGSMFTGGTGGLLAGGAMANLAARWLTNPDVVRRLAATTQLPKGSVPAMINSIRAEGERNQDQDLIALAEELEQRNGNPNSAPQ